MNKIAAIVLAMTTSPGQAAETQLAKTLHHPIAFALVKATAYKRAFDRIRLDEASENSDRRHDGLSEKPSVLRVRDSDWPHINGFSGTADLAGIKIAALLDPHLNNQIAQLIGDEESMAALAPESIGARGHKFVGLVVSAIKELEGAVGVELMPPTKALASALDLNG